MSGTPRGIGAPGIKNYRVQGRRGASAIQIEILLRDIYVRKKWIKNVTDDVETQRTIRTPKTQLRTAERIKTEIP